MKIMQNKRGEEGEGFSFGYKIIITIALTVAVVFAVIVLARQHFLPAGKYAWAMITNQFHFV